MDTVVAAPRALVDRAIVGPVHIRVRDGRIVDVRTGYPSQNGNSHYVDQLDSGVLSPGLVDIQINGAVGVDFAEVDDEGMRLVASSLPSTGVTRFLPTLITAPVPVALAQARAVLSAGRALPADSGARPLGVHLEGPFLSPVRHGVHDPMLMVDPTPDLIDEILADQVVAAGLRMVTLAPERPGALAAVRRLAAAGILVSVGHTDATAAQTRAAADAGARISPTCSTPSAVSGTASPACPAPRSPTTGSPSA